VAPRNFLIEFPLIKINIHERMRELTAVGGEGDRHFGFLAFYS
jgi:hypothetical protein